MTPAEIRQAQRMLAAMGIHTAGELLATGKRLRVVRNA